MKNTIRKAEEIVPEFPMHWTVKAFYLMGFLVFGCFFFNDHLFIGVFCLIVFVTFAVIGSEHRRVQLTNNFWYSAIRSFYVIGVPSQGMPDGLLTRFDRLNFVVYTDNRNVSALCAQINEELESADNDKDGVGVFGIAFDYGQRKGETVEEYAEYVENKVWTMIRKHEKSLLKNSSQSERVLEWYVKQGTGNDTSGSKYIVK